MRDRKKKKKFCVSTLQKIRFKVIQNSAHYKLKEGLMGIKPICNCNLFNLAQIKWRIYYKAQEQQKLKPSHETSILSQIASLQKQRISFRSFLQSLKKCPNREPAICQNPQEQSCILKPKTHQDQNHNQIQQFAVQSFQHPKIKAKNSAKTSSKRPNSNFRSAVKKSIGKQKKSNFIEQVSEARTKKSLKEKFQQRLKSINKSRTASQNSKPNPESHRYHQHIKKKPFDLHLQAIDFKRQNSQTQQKEPNSEKKLKLEQIESVAWNPDSKQFLTDLYKKQKPINTNAEHSLLIEIISLDISRNVSFLCSKKQTILNLNKIESKQIYDLFQQIFKINYFTTIKQPLIKKYNNCIFYGQKPNFEGTHAGIIVYLNGNAYFGSLVNFQKHGIGIDFIQSHQLPNHPVSPLNRTSAPDNFQEDPHPYVVFKGDFYKNSKSGQFFIQSSDYVYHGTIIKGFMEGTGTLITKSSVFKGTWSYNKKVAGVQILKSSSIIYQGEYSDEKFHGRGKLKTLHEFYEGEFANGFKSGKGILVNQSCIFQGVFKNGKKQGRGIFFDKNQYKLINPINHQNSEYDFGDCIYYVEFEEDQLVSKIKIDQPLDEESLKTFEERFEDEQAMLDFESIGPSNILKCIAEDVTPVSKHRSDLLKSFAFVNKKNIAKVPESFYQKYNTFLSILPSEPEEELLHYGTKRKSYLEGNRNRLSLIRCKKSMD